MLILIQASADITSVDCILGYNMCCLEEDGVQHIYFKHRLTKHFSILLRTKFPALCSSTLFRISFVSCLLSAGR